MYYLPFLIALGLSLATTPLWTKVAGRLGIVDMPRADRWHRRPTAKMGGVAMFLSTMIVLVLLRDLGTFDTALVTGATLMFAVGLADDYVRFRPRVKFLLQLAVAAVVAGLGLRFSLFGLPAADFALSVLWIVGIANAFNLIDNMDGLSAGASVVSGGAFFWLGLITGNPELLFYSAVQAGVALGFLVFNFNPARVFMGDCGSLFLGFLAAALGIIASISLPARGVLPFLSVLLILALPVFDTMFVVYQRRRHGRPISQGGKDHASHRLVALGLSERTAVMVLLLIELLSASVGVFAAYSRDVPEGAVALLLVLFGVLTSRVSRVNVYGR